MENIHNKIKAYLGRTPDFQSEVIIEDEMKDGVSNPFIAEWNIKDKNKPTDEQLNSFETEATKLKNNAKADINRETEYGSWKEQLDYIYHNGITKWKTDHIKPIKDKYPKE